MLLFMYESAKFNIKIIKYTSLLFIKLEFADSITFIKERFLYKGIGNA
jgi:hypothetical protein